MKSLILALFAFLVAFTAVPDLSAQKALPERIEGREFRDRFFQGPAFKRTQPAIAETWQLFPAGTLPIGKVVSERDAVNLAAGDYSAQSAYLIGSFVVTASSGDKAILRSTAKGAAFRVIVNYPSEVLSPPEGAKFIRDQSRAFQIRSVAIGADKTANLFVREVTLP